MIPETRAVIGLSLAEARRRLTEFGENALPETRADPLWYKLLQQFNNPLIFILLFALVIDAGIWLYEGADSVPLEALAIMLIMVANAGMGLGQDLKSEAALSRLKQLTAPQSWVYRDGGLQKVASRTLVPGDVVRVEAGERIPADGKAIKAQGFLVDESILTGESVPVDVANQQQVFSGTLAVRGFALIEITATGRVSTMGKLATMLAEIDHGITPLEKRLKTMGRKIALIVVSIAGALLAMGLGLTGLSHFSEIFLFAVALAVAAVPESLPAVITFALALGVERMARCKAVVRKLSAVETLGSVTVIATDKTGTLTENTMQVQALDCSNTDTAYRAMVLCNDADFETGAGDPLEIGIMQYVKQQAPETLAAILNNHARIASRPFDAEWKFMRVTVDDSDGATVSYLKGAPEALLARSVLDDDQTRYWNERIEHYARQGYRTLALAAGDGEAETELCWLGLIVLLDPPRAEVPDAIRQALKAGIRVLMITGDHPATASTVGERIGIPRPEAINGEELARLSGQALLDTFKTVNIFARVQPEQKLQIVTALKQQGEVVAVTGDGVNDAPALKAADVGIAMGQRGSDVSREVADLVLIDDNFSTIINAVLEGRNIYENIQKFIRSLFAANFAEVLLISIGALFTFYAVAGGASLILPITAAQILWINLLTDCVPALAIAADRNPGVLSYAPRSVSAPLLDHRSIVFIICVGLIGGVFSLGFLLLLPAFDADAKVVQTMTFCYLTLVQFTFVNPARKANHLPESNPFVGGALIAMLILQILVMTLPDLRRLLGLAVLDLTMWVCLALAVAVSWVLAAVCSDYLRKRLGHA